MKIMERLIIVDDDEVICNGLRQGIPWEENGIVVVGVAYDGEAALELIKERTPDIALLDINLPFLDGLELSGILRREYPALKIILLTAYEEFEFAKKAVKLHVHDYITKPFDNQKVLEAVCGARESLIRERDANHKIDEGLPLIKEKYLCDLLKRNIPPEKAAEIRNFIGLTADSYCGVSILSIKSYYLRGAVQNVAEINALINNDEFVKGEILAAVRELSDGRNVILLRGNEAELVMIYKDFDTREACAGYMKSQAERIRGRLATIDEYFLTISLGNVYWGLDRIAASYEEAKLAATYSWHFDNRSIIWVGEIDRPRDEVDLHIDEKQCQIINSLKYGLAEEMTDNIREVFANLKAATGLRFSYVRMVAVEIVIFACKAVADEGQNQPRLPQLSADLLSEVIRIESIAEAEEWVRRKLAELLKLSSEQRLTGTQKLINKALLYIQANFSNSDLSLDQVAQTVHLSPTYFSMLFRQCQGVNFCDYLETVRIRQAMELFNQTEMKIYEVADQVGYNSPQYFSICFKKITGFTPSEFRMKRNG